jgi:hypothetical protein
MILHGLHTLEKLPGKYASRTAYIGWSGNGVGRIGKKWIWFGL